MKFSQAKRGLLSYRLHFTASAATACSVYFYRNQDTCRSFTQVFKPKTTFAEKQNKDDIINNLI